MEYPTVARVLVGSEHKSVESMPTQELLKELDKVGNQKIHFDVYKLFGENWERKEQIGSLDATFYEYEENEKKTRWGAPEYLMRKHGFIPKDFKVDQGDGDIFEVSLWGTGSVHEDGSNGFLLSAPSQEDVDTYFYFSELREESEHRAHRLSKGVVASTLSRPSSGKGMKGPPSSWLKPGAEFIGYDYPGLGSAWIQTDGTWIFEEAYSKEYLKSGKAVSFPQAKKEVDLFAEKLVRQFHEYSQSPIFD